MAALSWYSCFMFICMFEYEIVIHFVFPSDKLLLGIERINIDILI